MCELVVEDTGTLDKISLGVREPLEGDFKRVYLVEKQSLNEFDLAWEPAIIGRKDHRNPSNNRLLAVDLEGVEDLPTVSRHHACITTRGGKFYIEQIQERNPTFVDGNKLAPNTKSPLPAGAVIQVGRISLTFNIRS
jgi:pSer/pThr/pTyr-binding forkhead associated (FHA) protein